MRASIALRLKYHAFAEDQATDYNPYFGSSALGVLMKSASFTLDRVLLELLQEQGLSAFTIQNLRDAYVDRLDVANAPIRDVRRYVYEQSRRLLKTGWIVRNDERRARGQIFHLLAVPAHLQLDIVDSPFSRYMKPANGQVVAPALTERDVTPLSTHCTAGVQLESLHKEIRLEFLTAMGEAERFKLLMSEIPELKSKIEHEYIDARDTSSRLLGHLRAIEKTLKSLSSHQ